MSNALPIFLLQHYKALMKRDMTNFYTLGHEFTVITVPMSMKLLSYFINFTVLNDITVLQLCLNIHFKSRENQFSCKKGKEYTFGVLAKGFTG